MINLPAQLTEDVLVQGLRHSDSWLAALLRMGGERMAVAIASGGQVFSLNVKEWMSTDLLGSREQGRKLRQLLVDSVEQQQTIHLDFRGIDVMTSAFADECFGKLWDIKPHHILKQMIRISGLTGNNKTVFRFVLQHRD